MPRGGSNLDPRGQQEASYNQLAARYKATRMQDCKIGKDSKAAKLKDCNIRKDCNIARLLAARICLTAWWPTKGAGGYIYI